MTIIIVVIIFVFLLRLLGQRNEARPLSLANMLW